MKNNVFDQNTKPLIRSVQNVFAEFLQTKGLYDTMEITEDNIQELTELLDGNVRISAYCKQCKSERVFTMKPVVCYALDRDEYEEIKVSSIIYEAQKFYASNSNNPLASVIFAQSSDTAKEKSRILIFEFVCAMDNSHHLDYIVLTDNSIFRKIGQYPSIADLSFPELDKYNTVMSTNDRRELGKALGLFANGIGVGSYVYLRRILERLLEKIKTDAGDTVDSDTFKQSRMGEKMKMLQDYLPKTLADNPSIYGILSKGIHELSEEECLSYFIVVKDCLLMIFDEWAQEKEKRNKANSIRSGLSKIASKLT